MTVTVEIDEVQANVLYGYKAQYAHALHLRLQVNEPRNAQAALARWIRTGLVRFGNARQLDVKAHVNVAFTFKGLKKLGLPPDYLAGFPDDFSQGARKGAERLGDRWHTNGGYQDSHVIVSIHGVSEAACNAEKEKLELDGLFGPVAQRRAQPTERSDTVAGDDARRERFGFADGRSQPAIEGVDLDPVGDGVYAGEHPTSGRVRRRLSGVAENFGLRPLSRNWRLIRPGEFLLGYENEDGELPAGPPAPLGPNGTFMVYREIEQYPGRFDDYVTTAAKTAGMSSDELAAKIVGRWKDGTPVARQPQEPDIAANRRRANDFRYEDDAYGFGCPLGAHVRRANPRDALPGGGERTMRHRIIRRGMPFGEGSTAGLAFICFSASIKNGFEFIQSEWLNTGEAFGLGGEPDFLLQQPDADGKLTGKTVIQGFRPIVLEPPPEPFVLVRGCEYLFVPSRRALTWLSQLTPVP
jgi:Dyp-type peroxidase family